MNGVKPPHAFTPQIFAEHLPRAGGGVSAGHTNDVPWPQGLMFWMRQQVANTSGQCQDTMPVPVGTGFHPVSFQAGEPRLQRNATPPSRSGPRLGVRFACGKGAAQTGTRQSCLGAIPAQRNGRLHACVPGDSRATTPRAVNPLTDVTTPQLGTSHDPRRALSSASKEKAP